MNSYITWLEQRIFEKTGFQFHFTNGIKIAQEYSQTLKNARIAGNVFVDSDIIPCQYHFQETCINCNYGERYGCCAESNSEYMQFNKNHGCILDHVKIDEIIDFVTTTER